MNFFFRHIVLCCFFLFSVPLQGQSFDQATKALEEAGYLFVAEGESLNTSLLYLDETWQEGYIPVLLDVLHFMNNKQNARAILQLLGKKTGQTFGSDLDAWNKWLWNRPIRLLPIHADWMAGLYENIDPRFAQYFQGRTASTLIRLDEIKWGGVIQDGIPPLRNPRMINAEDARYLDKNDIVFGISINGDHRAYPKRILAWHEMFVDNVGGLPIAGVYCTLCGTVIAYESQFEGREFHMGTSGFLYRSNKLMFDASTQSLWNTIEGKPVLGPLIDQGIVFPTHSVVTTTWGEWKNLHPDTRVLSLETGHTRDYSEGKAYEKYFGTDELMFQIPKVDKRLKNKDEVFVLRLPEYTKDPLAISAKFLKKNSVYHDQINEQKFVVLTDKSGANRAYLSDDIRFEKYRGNTLLDSSENKWQVFEDYLENEEGVKLYRIPGHRVFWFAWYSMYQHTRLIW